MSPTLRWYLFAINMVTIAISFACVWIVRWTRRKIEEEHQALQTGQREFQQFVDEFHAMFDHILQGRFTISFTNSDDSDDMFRHFEEDVKDITVDPSEIEDFYKLDDMALLARFEQVSHEIKDAQQQLSPRTQSARDLHSLRYAMQLELQRRGISIGLE